MTHEQIAQFVLEHPECTVEEMTTHFGMQGQSVWAVRDPCCPRRSLVFGFRMHPLFIETLRRFVAEDDDLVVMEDTEAAQRNTLVWRDTPSKHFVSLVFTYL
jgi:hypothetical protein